MVNAGVGSPAQKKNRGFLKRFGKELSVPIFPDRNPADETDGLFERLLFDVVARHQFVQLPRADAGLTGGFVDAAPVFGQHLLQVIPFDFFNSQAAHIRQGAGGVKPDLSHSRM